jgi:hypothetical protein
MNSTIVVDDKFAYHTFTNVEFSAYLVRWQNLDYYFFIKYGDKVWVEAAYNDKQVVISFAELQKNRYLKFYYDISLMLTKNKNLVIQEYNRTGTIIGSEALNKERGNWTIDTAFIDDDFWPNPANLHVIDNEDNCYTKFRKFNINPYDTVNKKYICYYKINPYDLENMEYSSQEVMYHFHRLCKRRRDLYWENRFETDAYCRYNNLVIDYSIKIMEKELNELFAIFENKKNVLNLATLYDKKCINGDILKIIYGHIISSEINNKYSGIIDKIDYYKNKLERNIQILEA